MGLIQIFSQSVSRKVFRVVLNTKLEYLVLNVFFNILKLDISRALSDLNIQEWNEKATISSKGKPYLLFKDNLNFEKIFD